MANDASTNIFLGCQLKPQKLFLTQVNPILVLKHLQPHHIMLLETVLEDAGNHQMMICKGNVIHFILEQISFLQGTMLLYAWTLSF